MAPNVVPFEINQRLEENSEVEKAKKEIFYNGYFYDVSDFVSRHPGGNVITFYTQKGEDATQAIDQFHFRSRKRIEAIMKGFNRRKADSNDRGLEPKALSRHDALSADFKQLFEELQAEGYFKPSKREIILRLLECVSLVFLSYGVMGQCETVTSKLLASAFVGFAVARHGWLQHEAGHSSLTGNPKIDKMIQNYLGCVIIGGSCVWWNSQHNRHHAMPQRLEHDVDLSTLPYVAFHRRTVKDKKEINRFFVRFQAIFYWTLDLFIITIAWKFILHPRYQIRKKAYLEMLLNIPTFFLMYSVGPFYYFMISYWFAFNLGLNFALSHSHLEVADKPTHWVEYSLTHTANISSNIFVDYWMGYLNYQIEHHLFPTMPQFRQKQITHRVRALAEKHGLPYRVFSYPEACYLALKNLDDVGKELTSKEE